jgi:hypothetical protein
MQKNKINFNIFEKSILEKMNFSTQKNDSFNFVKNYNKNYVEKILSEYK